MQSLLHTRSGVLKLKAKARTMNQRSLALSVSLQHVLLLKLPRGLPHWPQAQVIHAGLRRNAAVAIATG